MIYLDTAATTKIRPDVFDAMEPYLRQYYGNASSHHSLGLQSKTAIDESREIIASVLNCKPQEIYFTSGGSEANTWAIRGFKNPYHRNSIHIISSTQEHHSILNALAERWIQTHSTEYTLIKADPYGIVNIYDLEEQFRLNTRLCSIQYINNETGIIQPISQIANKCKDEGCAFHVDAVQAFGYQKIDVKELGIDMLSASAHKIHGPKGVGFLYISDDIRNQIDPWINGGQQERGLRGSTENVAGIVGFGKATQIAYDNLENNQIYIKVLGTELVSMLSKLPGVHTNVDLNLTDYRHISIRLDDIRAEEMLSLMDSVGICISSGSACSSNTKEPSHVLKAIGLSNDAANSTIRVSLCEDNTLDELVDFVTYLKDFLQLLRERENG